MFAPTRPSRLLMEDIMADFIFGCFWCYSQLKFWENFERRYTPPAWSWSTGVGSPTLTLHKKILATPLITTSLLERMTFTAHFIVPIPDEYNKPRYRRLHCYSHVTTNRHVITMTTSSRVTMTTTSKVTWLQAKSRDYGQQISKLILDRGADFSLIIDGVGRTGTRCISYIDSSWTRTKGGEVPKIKHRASRGNVPFILHQRRITNSNKQYFLCKNARLG